MREVIKSGINKYEMFLHCAMCVIGGYYGGYAVISRADNFGSAQTANWIGLVLTLLGRNWEDFELRLAGVILYILAVAIANVLSKKSTIDVKKYSILVDMLGAVFLAFIPADANPIAGLLPIFFMMATQWTIFHGIGEYNSSTIFSTNNVKQTTLSLTNYLMDGNRKHLVRAKFFANSLLWFHVGVAISYFACKAWEIEASYFAIFLCALALFFEILYNKKNK